MGKLPIPDPTTESSECTPVTESSESVHLDEESDSCRNLPTLESVNQCLGEIGETPVVKKKLQQVHYPKDKLKRITTAMKKVVIQDAESSEPGHSIAAETCESVCRFYESDEVSRIDFVSVRLGGKREHFQRRLLLGNLRECINCSKTSFQPTPLVFQSLLSFARSTAFWPG